MEKDKEKVTLVVSVYPACGKTYSYKNFKKMLPCTNKVDELVILDSDSSKFGWIYKNGIKTNQRNPNFIQDYINHIKENVGKADIIFVSSHKEVRQALRNNNIKYFIVYPMLDMKDVIIERMVKRGNDEKFIELQKRQFEESVNEINNEYDGKNGFPFALTKDSPYLPLGEIVLMLDTSINGALSVKWWN